MADATLSQNSTDFTKLKVPDLKKELKLRGLSTTGNKNELIERLQKNVKTNDTIGSESVDDLEEELLNDDDDDHSEENESSILENDFDESPKSVKRILSESSETEGSTPVPAKKIVLTRHNSVIDPIKATEKQPEPEKSPPKEEKKIIKLSNLTAKDRLEMRAKKFGVSTLSADAKKLVRAERFGKSDNSATSITSTAVNTSVDVLKQRAQRFGSSVSTVMSGLENEEKMLKRKARFSNSANGTTTASEKGKQRLERFKQPIHRGPLQQLRDEYSTQKSMNPEPKPKITAAVTKTEYQPVRDIVKDLEKDNKQSEEERNNLITRNLESELDKVNTHAVVPPKPLPRTSRTSSICEATIEDPNAPKPVARPRTNSVAPIVTSVNPSVPIAGGYKPRLGPKPFTPPNLGDNENAFTKVFAVPAVPGQNGICSDKPQSPVEEKDKSPTIAVAEPVPSKTDTESGKSGSSGEDETSGDSGYIPRTPTTAERRKMFETHSNSKENESEENLDSVDFERGSMRASIAERRKMYESRSQSVQEQGVEKKEGSPVMLRRKDSLKNKKNTEDLLKDDNNRKSVPMPKQQSMDPVSVRKSEVSMPTPKRTSTVFGRVSKFRHLKGTPSHKSFHIENIRNLSRQISGECDGFHANPERVAVPLSGPGGKIATFELSKTGKLPDGVIPALVNGNNIMDFAWDPFDFCRLAVACDDGVVKLWRIPEGGLLEPTNEPESELNAHSDKIYFIKFHPTAKDVLATGSYDMSIKLWDLATLTEKITLKGHTDQMFSFAWSPCGSFCATVSKDSKIRIYKPRQSDSPIREGKGPEGNRGARIVWALDGHFIVVTGFDKVSERQITAYKSNDLSSPLNTVGLDVSPAILIPFYDEDSSTLFVTGRGDSTIYAFEITEETPNICPLSHHRCNGLHQGLSFLPKNVCDVSNVEFAKAYRLTNNSIEPLSFTVPRIKTDLFQDDLFPPTRVTWTPTLTSSEWFSGSDKIPKRISLKPEGMDLLSESQGQPNTASERTINKSASTPFIGSAQAYRGVGWDADISGQTKNKQEELKKSVSSKLEVNMSLEQDNMEGVDEKEWNE